ncbi:MAG: hypothetical protein KIT19_07785 [Phycisphaeraceae bacterium]|nr:hypothetical protein [Phycisphaeraceae bacterium]MCW5768570.1 hypothetical protein [Phycisphaeraceae bacterium]
MLKPGADPMSVNQSDVLCNFCAREWTDDLPLVEGHQGSIICGVCLKTACKLLDGGTLVTSHRTCTMCLEHRDDPAWESPWVEGSVICGRCINLGATALSKDKDYAWKRSDTATE